MELTLAFDVVNWYAVLVAALASFLLAGIWYSPVLFGRFGVLAENAETRGGPARRIEIIFVAAFGMQWITASLLAAILGPNSDLSLGLNVGALIGLFFVGTGVGITSIFERRPYTHVLIDGGYHLVNFCIMGGIIGSWH
jgi:hypothetical protein